ncbi:hypothetical protein Mal15_55480 [Stieleria maiorica]|uniref:HEAT repeat domain-containing protein n=1 Tax=Stieleria maiorica TaxID=2795974 RepID=A0A5B9MJM3_9BACT|nr:hypothetical protein [Stieleria maiorica]QEG01472.1 hypothetical protein Mal15_55480 [Stieleria maiorica]
MTNSRNRFSIGVCLIAVATCAGCASVPPAAPAPAAPTSAQAGATTIVAVAAPAAPGMTLPQFLGLDLVFGGIRTVGGRVRNRLGTRFPGLEARPPIKSITDPSNLGPDASPAEKAAAEAKIEQDKAPQKAKAIKFLAKQGCGKCNEAAEDALLAALDDCSEDIRIATLDGLREAVTGKGGCICPNSCCSPKLLKKLYEIVYEKDDCNEFVEPSHYVRRRARLVICACSGATPIDGGTAPMEGPTSVDAVPTPAGEVTPAVAANAVMPESKSSDVAAQEVVPNNDATADQGIAVVGHTEADATTATVTTTAGFLLPESFDPTLQSDHDSVRRE